MSQPNVPGTPDPLGSSGGPGSAGLPGSGGMSGGLGASGTPSSQVDVIDVSVTSTGEPPIVGGEVLDASASKPGLRTRAKSTVSQASTTVKQSAQQGRQKAVSTAQSNPFGLALGSLGLGLILGLMLPTSRLEQEKLGPVADSIKDAGQKAKQSVAEVKDAAVADAKQQS